MLRPFTPTRRQQLRSKLFRVLRIAASFLFGVLCLLSVAWWVRSYSWADSAMLKLAPSLYIQVHDGDGRMCIWIEHQPIDKWWAWWANPITDHTLPEGAERIPWLDIAFWPTFIRIYTAHAFLTVIAGVLALAPWCPRKFSLRALLGAITVIGAVAGVIAWVDNTF